jgi:hypothetical protein
MCFDVITRRMQMGTIRIIKVQQAGIVAFDTI